LVNSYFSRGENGLWASPEIELTFSLCAFLIASLFDFVITIKALKVGMTEANPMIRGIFNQFGWSGILAWKIIIFLLLALLAYSSKINANIIWIGVALYLSANIIMLIDMQRNIKILKSHK
jgi:hypothetical protein